MPNSLGGSRAVDSAPLSKPKNTTILSSIQTLRYTTFSGGTTVERFKRYLEIDLLPHLNGNSVLIMDNTKSHHTKAVRNLLDSFGVRYIYLPPYSPDLNADKHSPASSARSTKQRVRGDAYVSGS